MGRQEQTPARFPCSQLATLHGVPRTQLMLSNNSSSNNRSGYGDFSYDDRSSSKTRQYFVLSSTP